MTVLEIAMSWYKVVWPFYISDSTDISDCRTVVTSCFVLFEFPVSVSPGKFQEGMMVGKRPGLLGFHLADLCLQPLC